VALTVLGVDFELVDSRGHVQGRDHRDVSAALKSIAATRVKLPAE
jgi:hypothetical protein